PSPLRQEPCGQTQHPLAAHHGRRDPLRGSKPGGAADACAREPRHRPRPGAATRLSAAQRPAEPDARSLASCRQGGAREVSRSRLLALSASVGTQEPPRAHTLGRRAANAGARAGPDGAAGAGDGRRAVSGARTPGDEGHAGGVRDAEGRGNGDPIHRTERAPGALYGGPRLHPGKRASRDRWARGLADRQPRGAPHFSRRIGTAIGVTALPQRLIVSFYPQPCAVQSGFAHLLRPKWHASMMGQQKRPNFFGHTATPGLATVALRVGPKFDDAQWTTTTIAILTPFAPAHLLSLLMHRVH